MLVLLLMLLFFIFAQGNLSLLLLSLSFFLFPLFVLSPFPGLLFFSSHSFLGLKWPQKQQKASQLSQNLEKKRKINTFLVLPLRCDFIYFPPSLSSLLFPPFSLFPSLYSLLFPLTLLLFSLSFSFIPLTPLPPKGRCFDIFSLCSLRMCPKLSTFSYSFYSSGVFGRGRGENEKKLSTLFGRVGRV